ncbi:capsule polysaccharide biosynthesis/export KpsS-like protein [Rhizobium etli 8C-3]|uniref:Capsule polysaccharide biosynthesis/export KpsS-like protein n=1 Tax=Rhizobium etli 8C-3 TaxID=538025 RepID=A0A1L5P6W7_RHIET|nr:capsular biosynthesis protein [Rhizobium etli]APO75894.1 capsule polysaccharide biosynthesis/export KpsS-like protein [Rhizobium etli 8C-3]
MIVPVVRSEEKAKRVFLFLQGPSSMLYCRIADRLEAAGCACLRVNLNSGDWLFWRRRGALNYRGPFAAWSGYVRHLIADSKITDLIVHGEERPYHRAAIAEARMMGVSIYAIEMGHLRPDWVTIEREGLSSNSRFPADPDHILAAAEGLPEPDWNRRYSHTFLSEAIADLLYYLPTVFLSLFYPHYRRHGLFHPLAEYAGWLRRLATGRKRAREANLRIGQLSSDNAAFFVYPLQIETDYQLRAHSPFHSQRDAIRYILRSFAEHAPQEAKLLVKVHPLDNGLIDWDDYVNATALSLGLSGRVQVIDGGDLSTLIAASRGMVTVNSTAALSALQAGKPVKTLGVTIYDIEGLTDPGSIDRFWQDPQPPSAKLLGAFMRLLAASVQVRGNFYSKEGAKAAAESIASRLLVRNVNEPGAYVEPPIRKHPVKIDVP